MADPVQAGGLEEPLRCLEGEEERKTVVEGQGEEGRPEGARARLALQGLIPGQSSPFPAVRARAHTHTHVSTHRSEHTQT